MRRVLAFFRANIWMISLPFAALVRLDEVVLEHTEPTPRWVRRIPPDCL